MTKKSKLLIGFISFFIITLIIILCLYSYNNLDEAYAIQSTDYELVNFSDSYNANSYFPYYSSPKFYSTNNHIIPGNNISFSGYTEFGNEWGVNCGGSTSCINQLKTLSINSNSYNLDVLHVSPGSSWTLFYFWPTRSSYLKNSNKDYYLNFYLSGNFSNVELNTTINNVTGSGTSVINSTFNGGLCFHWTLSNSNVNTYFRILIETNNNSPFDISCCISDKSHVFSNDNIVTSMNIGTSFNLSMSSDQGYYGFRYPFNLGGNIGVDNLGFWSYEYMSNFSSNYSTNYNVTLYINNTYVSFYMGQGEPYYGVDDVRYICYVGNFTYNGYKIFVNFYNCNYEAKDYLYDFVLDFYSSNNLTYNIKNIKISLLNNVLNNDNYNSGYVTGYNNALISLETQKTMSYQSGYSDGYSDGLELAQGGTFLMLLTSVVEAPFRAFLDILDFEILGYNMKAFLGALISIALALFVIRMILNGSTKNG